MGGRKNESRGLRWTTKEGRNGWAMRRNIGKEVRNLELPQHMSDI